MKGNKKEINKREVGRNGRMEVRRKERKGRE